MDGNYKPYRICKWEGVRLLYMRRELQTVHICKCDGTSKWGGMNKGYLYMTRWNKKLASFVIGASPEGTMYKGEVFLNGLCAVCSRD